MMAAVSAAFAQEPVKLLGAECVRKSYPEFWDHFIQLGGKFVASYFGKHIHVSVFGQSTPRPLG